MILGKGYLVVLCIFKDFLYILYTYMYVFMCKHLCVDAFGGQKRVLDSRAAVIGDYELLI